MLSRQQAVEAVTLLNDFWWEIYAGDGLLGALTALNVQVVSGDHRLMVQRMAFFNVVLVLCKLDEFRLYYLRLLSEECRAWLKEFGAEYERRGLRHFRNKVVGHILDDDTNEPLSPERIQEMFMRAVDNDSRTFFRWLRNPESPDDLDTVLGRVKWLKGKIQDEHGLARGDARGPAT